eukprot:TCONS_00052101-protein
MIQYILLFSRQGKLRLQKWYHAIPLKDKKKITRDLTTMILSRKPKMCSFLEYKDLKVVYKRYASLFFCVAIERGDNELLSLEIIHRYVEILDKYFGNVSRCFYTKASCSLMLYILCRFTYRLIVKINCLANYFFLIL